MSACKEVILNWVGKLAGGLASTAHWRSCSTGTSKTLETTPQAPENLSQLICQKNGGNSGTTDHKGNFEFCDLVCRHFSMFLSSRYFLLDRSRHSRPLFMFVDVPIFFYEAE